MTATTHHETIFTKQRDPGGHTRRPRLPTYAAARLGRPRPLLCIALLLSAGSAAADARPPTAQEMWRIIQQQQQQIEQLTQQLKTTDRKVRETTQKVEETDQKVETAADMIEQTEATVSRAASWAEKTKIGGYGELHYNNLDSKEEVDFHRFVLFFSHEFTDDIRFFSELELEHAFSGGDEPGEVELEQAYLEFDLNQKHSAIAGMFLLPLGILNETHEPTTFYGVERNPVETNIIPTTWWEAGAGLHGEFLEGLSYDLAGTSGLNVPTSGNNAFLIRKGRQKVAKAKANDGAVTGRVKWTGIPGVELGVAGQWQRDVTQGEEGVGATLFEAHATVQKGPFGLRALYARWDLQDKDLINASDPNAEGRDEQVGWYVEPSFKTHIPHIRGEWGLFARYNVWDNNAGSSNTDSEMKQVNAGLNYWPIPEVVFKFDVQQQDNDGAKNDNGFNLGLGYAF